MSMLAASKRKQKWTLNPRGKQWSEDSNKFGQKILEKMGWSSGKGLGANEQGMVEHVRVRVKNDQVGIGYTKDRDNQWTEHQDDFNSFLQNLQKETFTKTSEDAEDKDKVLSGMSLEEKSKQSQKRVHYKKFTRGKDVNKYSTKDLANIFGKKDLNEKPKQIEKEEEDSQVCDPVGTKDTTAGIVTFKGGNINEYFSKKIVKSELGKVGKDQECSESETETRTGFGISSKSKSTFYVKDNADLEKEDSSSENDKYKGFGFIKSSETKVKSKKLNNLNYVFDNPCLDLNILDDSLPKGEKSNDGNLESVTPKKRKNQDFDVESPDKPKSKKQKKEYTYDNDGLNVDFPDNSIKIKNENEVISEKQVSKKSKKDKKSKGSTNSQYENQGLDLDFQENTTVKISENTEVPSVKETEGSAINLDVTPKKSKKSKKFEVASSGIENPALDLNFPDRPTPQKSKKNKDFENSGGIENPGLDLEFPDNPTPKKVKKNKDSKISSAGIENPALDLNFPDSSTPNKSRRKRDIEVPPVGIENPGLDLEFPDRPTPKKQKKDKNTSEISSNGLENPALDLGYPEGEICNATDFEVPRACGVENSALNLSDEEKRKKRVTFNDEIEYITDSVNKKKKKLDKYEVVNDKVKKKKNAEPVAFVNEALDVVEVINLEEVDNEINEKKSQKGRRKRERRISLLETIEEADEEDSKEISIVDVQENGNVEIINEFPCGDVQEVTNEDSQKKKKSKKKKKNKKKVNETSEASEESKEMEEVIEEIDLTEKEAKKKKKKKIKSEVTEIEKIKSEVIENVKIKSEVTEDEKIKSEVIENVKIKSEVTQANDKEDSGKENVCSMMNQAEDGDGKKKKTKKKSDKDVVSLEEFLNEDNEQEQDIKPQRRNVEPEVVRSVSQKPVIHRVNYENYARNRNFDRSKPFRKQTPKQIMKALFMKNPTLLFNGSNINEINGYGENIIS